MIHPSVRMWAVKGPNGRIVLWSLSPTKKTAENVAEWFLSGPPRTETIQRSAHRVVRVDVKEMEDD